MKITILAENNAGGKYLAEHGLSYLIEIDDQKILFDTGHSDVFLKNAQQLGIDIENEVKTVVLSHGHWDHGDGLRFLQNKRLVIITGCSHSGICNIVEQAKIVTGISTVETVLGGFHLKEQNEQTRKTIAYFKANQIEQIFPSHCTELPALAAFYETFQIRQIKTGMVLEF